MSILVSRYCWAVCLVLLCLQCLSALRFLTSHYIEISFCYLQERLSCRIHASFFSQVITVASENVRTGFVLTGRPSKPVRPDTVYSTALSLLGSSEEPTSPDRPALQLNSTMQQERAAEDAVRPSHGSDRGLLRSAASPPQDPRYGPRESYLPPMQFERATDEPTPSRIPSRQMMRWGQTSNDYGMDERAPYGRPSYDYAPRSSRPDAYPDDGYYTTPTPTRRMHSVSMRDGPPPRRPSVAYQSPLPRQRKPRVAQYTDEMSDYESEEEPKKPRRRAETSRGGSPPPEEVMRLPLTMWMNSGAKNRESDYVT